MVPGFKNFNNSQKLYILSFILGFNRDYLPKKNRLLDATNQNQIYSNLNHLVMYWSLGLIDLIFHL